MCKAHLGACCVCKVTCILAAKQPQPLQGLTLRSPPFLWVLEQCISFESHTCWHFWQTILSCASLRGLKKKSLSWLENAKLQLHTFSHLTLPASQLDVLILKILKHKSVSIFPCWVTKGYRGSQAFQVRKKVSSVTVYLIQTHNVWYSSVYRVCQNLYL